MTERVFAVLYVSVMGLTPSYKTTDLNIYICSFSTEFTLEMYIIAQTYLRFCKKQTEAILEYNFRFRFNFWFQFGSTHVSDGQNL